MKPTSLLQMGGLAALFAISPLQAQHPGPEPRPGFSTQTLSADGTTTFVVSPESTRPVGDNELGLVLENSFDSNGVEMPFTLPSTPQNPFNLHAAPVQIIPIDPTSPLQDMQMVIAGVLQAAQNGFVDQDLIRFGLDVLEGNPVGRTYSGMAMLHYTGPERIKVVEPVFDAQGNKVGGNVDIHQVWWDERIESDTMFIDPTQVQEVPFTITYTVDVLTGGADDFAPFVCYFDAPPTPDSFVETGTHGPPHIGMDTSFFPMSQGHRYVIKINHPAGKYFNLIYTWGWRIHPPRVQATENALKEAGGIRLPDHERLVFGDSPRSSEEAKLAAIAKIAELAPAKRMWQALRDAQTASASQVAALMQDADAAFQDWTDRRSLPAGIPVDPEADVTIAYLNNTIYGNATTYNNFTGRGSVFKATVYNGDHFVHGYMNVDFGGSRGWENQYQYAGGPGSAHTFGRNHWWPTAGGPNGAILVPPADSSGNLGLHKIEIVFNFDLAERLALYQFDPLHHDVAVYSLH